jgi:hypothetical protein
MDKGSHVSLSGLTMLTLIKRITTLLKLMGGDKEAIGPRARIHEVITICRKSWEEKHNFSRN